MKYQIKVDDSKILAENYIDGKIYRWIYDSGLTDDRMLVFLEIEKNKINYIHICHPDNFILEGIEESFKNSYFNYDLSKSIKQQGE